MRSLVLSSFIFSSLFGAYPATGLVDPETGKNYHVKWLPCAKTQYAPEGQGLSKTCGTIPTLDISHMVVVAECGGTIDPVFGNEGLYLDQCWFTSGTLVDALDCPTGKLFYTNGECYKPCNLSPTKKGVIDASNNSCVPSPHLPTVAPSFDLHDYDADPYECVRHGGFPDFSLMVPKRNGHFRGNLSGVLPTVDHQGNVVSSVEAKCNTALSTAITAAASIYLAKVALASNGKIDPLIDRGIAKVKGWWADIIRGKTPPVNLTISLPKYHPATPTNPSYTDVEILSKDIAKGADGITPKDSPKADIDPYTTFLREEYFPSNGLGADDKPLSGGESTSSLADINRFNSDNRIFKDNGVDPIDYTSKGNIFEEVAGTSPTVSVQDSPLMYSSYPPKFNTTEAIVGDNYQVFPADSTTFYPPVPRELSPSPIIRTSSEGMDGTHPTKIWTNDIAYEDGSSLKTVYTLDTVTKRGTKVSTTLDTHGNSSTTGLRFEMPNYKPDSVNPADYAIIKDSPVNTGIPTIGKDISPITPSGPIDPATGYPKPSKINNSDIVPNGVTPKDALNETTMIPFDPTPLPEVSFIADSSGAEGRLGELVKSVGDMGTNIQGSYNSINKIFNDDISLLKGKGFTPLNPPSAGQCGDMLVIHFHGTDTDLCPPMATTVNKVSPLFETLTIIVGIAISISIFLGGF